MQLFFKTPFFCKIFLAPGIILAVSLIAGGLLAYPVGIGRLIFSQLFSVGMAFICRQHCKHACCKPNPLFIICMNTHIDI